MSTITASERLDDLIPDRIVLLWGALLVLLEAMAVLLFVSQPRIVVRDPLVYVYPFVWINLGLWATSVVEPPDAESHQRQGAAIIVAGYTLVLAYAAGMLSGGGAPPGVDGVVSLTVANVPPGWGPYATVYAPGFSVQLMPYQVIGYAALVYLVYVGLLDVATSAAGAGLGLLTCVSCSWPVLASLLSGVVGSTAALTAAVYGQPYGLATVAYVLTVGVLVYRPGVGWRPFD
jgi:hypothetical protein